VKKSGITILWLMLAAWPVLAAKLVNPSFETGTWQGWNVAGANWRISTWKADQRRGMYGVVTDIFTNDAGDEFRLIYQEVKASPGRGYNAKTYIRGVCVESSESFLEVQFLDKKGAVLAQYRSPGVTNDQDFTLTTITNMIAPPDTEKASIRGVVFVREPPRINTDFHVFDNFDFDALAPSELRKLQAPGP